MKLPSVIALFYYSALLFAQSKETVRFQPGFAACTARSVNTDLIDELIRREKANYKMQYMRSHPRMRPLNVSRDTLAEGRIIGSWSERGSNNLAGRMHTCDVDWDLQMI